MISRIHNKLGTAGFVVAIVALVAALSGAAIAANGGLTGKQKKEVKKIAKKFAGKDGKDGAQGPKGDPGAKGDTGAPGAAGKDGTNGTNGTDGVNGADGADGAPGASVTGTPIAAGGACGTQTGVKYSLSGTDTNVCNGTTGFTKTLPVGETETGVWAATQDDATKEEQRFVTGSYNIPLAKVPTRNYINSAGEAKVGNIANCPGSFTEPKANEGNLCVYTSPTLATNLGALFIFQGGLASAANHKYGWILKFLFIPDAVEPFEPGAVVGTWAVTAGP
ncbi:MAG TPA: hypothetical protein VFY75_08795 [Solirubrobacterales bacterium]|nr:hypothetical protein [Solirubrobacterales bacterium]